MNPENPIAQASHNDCLDLMHTLMAYRHQPINSQLMKIRHKYSMLHVDVLILIYYLAKVCSGAILEIGAFVGGATIAAALGVRDSGQEKKLIAIEPGGSVKHKRLGTRNILRDLERNLARERVANMVTLVKGKSFKPETTSAVRQALGSDQVGLLILDADAAKRRDIDCYRDKFAEGSWMVIDDIYGADANEKITPSRADVDALVAEGLLEPLGFYGWSTWIGRWRGAHISRKGLKAFKRSEESLIYFLALAANLKSEMFRFAQLTVGRVTPCAPLHFLRSHNQMDHAIRRGDKEAVKIFAQLLDFVPSRDAVNFQK